MPYPWPLGAPSSPPLGDHDHTALASRSWLTVTALGVLVALSVAELRRLLARLV